jgi:hypothetical protein
MLQLAEKHELTPEVFHACMTNARERGTGRVGKFTIALRDHGVNSSVYMFLFDGKPLGQAEIRAESIEKLRRLPSEFRFQLPRRVQSQTWDGEERTIRDLRLGLKGVSFKAHIVKKSDVRAVTSRDGNPLLVCSVTLSDGTGEIPLAIWNNQINTVSEGDLVQVHDARVRSFRGEIQLALNRKTGTLTVVQPQTRSSHHARRQEAAQIPV